VALDLELDDDLRAEGVARELVRALNDLRKERDLDIADRITLVVEADDDLGAVIDAHHDWIAGEVLATDLQVGAADGDADQITVDGHPVRVKLEVV
jgi:isoleucyl-tRNA synthetase